MISLFRYIRNKLWTGDKIFSLHVGARRVWRRNTIIIFLLLCWNHHAISRGNKNKVLFSFSPVTQFIGTGQHLFLLLPYCDAWFTFDWWLDTSFFSFCLIECVERVGVYLWFLIHSETRLNCWKWWWADNKTKNLGGIDHCNFSFFSGTDVHVWRRLI